MIHDDIAQVYFTADEVRQRVHELGVELTQEYKGKNPIFVSVLKGSFIFMADLMRELDLYCDMDFLTVSSYGSGTTTTGAVKIIKDLSFDIENRHLIIVEDILDSGITLSYLKKYLTMRNPASIKICTLLDKPSRRQSGIVADYIGFTCPNDFIVGYGLDYDEKYRNLPYIGGLKPEVYA